MRWLFRAEGGASEKSSRPSGGGVVRGPGEASTSDRAGGEDRVGERCDWPSTCAVVEADAGEAGGVGQVKHLSPTEDPFGGGGEGPAGRRGRRPDGHRRSCRGAGMRGEGGGVRHDEDKAGGRCRSPRLGGSLLTATLAVCSLACLIPTALGSLYAPGDGTPVTVPSAVTDSFPGRADSAADTNLTYAAYYYVTPYVGVASGGTAVTLTLASGSLKAGTTALFCRFGDDGATMATAVSFENSGATVVCTAPAGAAGTGVHVQLSYDGFQFTGTSTSLFWYFGTVPNPTKITPESGSQLGGTIVTVTFDAVGGDPLAKLEEQAGVAGRQAAAVDYAVCRFNGENGAATSAGVSRYRSSDTGEFCVVCVVPSRSESGGRDRVRIEVSIDGGLIWSAETEFFEYLNGEKNFGSEHSQMLSYDASDIRGIVSGADSQHGLMAADVERRSLISNSESASGHSLEQTSGSMHHFYGISGMIEVETGISTAGVSGFTSASTDATLIMLHTDTVTSLTADYYGHMVPQFDGRNPSIGTASAVYRSTLPYSYAAIKLRAIAASPTVFSIVVTAEDPMTVFGTTNPSRMVTSNEALDFSMPDTISQGWHYSGANSPQRQFGSSSTSFNVTVTAEDQVTSRTYHFELTRLDVSFDTQLSRMNVLGVDSSATFPKSGVFTYDLKAPTTNFMATTTNYFLEVELNFANIQLQPWTYNERSIMEMVTGCPSWNATGGGERPASCSAATPELGFANAITNGTASSPVALTAGSNTTIRILVTSESHYRNGPTGFSDGDGFPPNGFHPPQPKLLSRVYHNVVIFRRTKSNVTTLSNIFLNWQNVYWNISTDFTFTLTPDFTTGTPNYAATVAHDVEYITVTCVAPDTTITSQYDNYPRATVDISDGTRVETVMSGVTSTNRALAIGTNTLTLTVRAEDGTETDTPYRVVVTRAAAATETRIASLVVRAHVIPDNSVEEYMATGESFYGFSDDVELAAGTAMVGQAGNISLAVASSAGSGGQVRMIAGVTDTTMRATELVKVEASTMGAGVSRTVGMTGFDREHGQYMLRDPLQRYTYLAHQPINGLAVEHNVSAIEVELNMLSIFGNDFEGEVSGQPKATVTLNGAEFRTNITHTLALKAGTWPNHGTTELTWVVTAQNAFTRTYSLTVVRAAREPDAAYFVKYYDSVRAPEANTAWAGRNLNFQFAINVARWASALPFATAGPGNSTHAAAPDVSAIPRMEWHVTSRWIHTRTNARAVYTSNAAIVGYVAEATNRPVFIMPADGFCIPRQNTVCRFKFCQNASLSSFEEYTAYPPVNDIRWNRLTTLFNDYRFAGHLGYPCSKQLNWTEIAQVAPAMHYVSDAAHGSTAGGAGTVHAYTVSYGPMSIFHSVVTVEDVWKAGPYVINVGGRDKYGNVVDNTPRAYLAKNIGGMVCPPETDLTAPIGITANCTCGLRTKCAAASFATFTSLGDGNYRGELLVEKAGNNSLYVSASYKEQTTDLSGFGDEVVRYQEWPVRVFIVPNVLSTRSRIVTSESQYRAGGAMAFEVRAIDAYGNEITQGGEDARFTTFTSPATKTTHIVTDANTGIYQVTVRTTLASPYLVSFTVNGSLMVRNPSWTVEVLAGNVNSSHSTAAYPTTAAAGIDNKFTIEPRDMYNNVVSDQDDLGGTCPLATATTSNINNCRVYLQVFDEERNLIPQSESRTRIEYVNNTYYGHFTPPTSSSLNVYIKVFINSTYDNDNRHKPIIGSTDNDNRGKFVDLVPGPAEFATSDLYINDTQGVGYVFVGVFPRDQFSNPCDFKRPSEFSVWAMDVDRNPSRIEADISDVRYYGMNGTETIILDQVKLPGTYELQILLRGAKMDREGYSPRNITVIPGPLGVASLIAEVPDSVPVLLTTTLLLKGFDVQGNKILKGGESAGITVTISSPSDVIEVTVEDLAAALPANITNYGNYIIAFSPGQSGNYVMVISIYGRELGRQSFVAELLNAKPKDFSVQSDAVMAGSVVNTSAGTRVDFIVGSEDVDMVLDLRANIIVTARFIGVNGVAPTGAAAATEVLNVSPVNSRRERYFWLSRTEAGEYEIVVKLSETDIGKSPYVLNVAGGPPVNHLGSGRKGLATAAYPSGAGVPTGPAMASKVDFIAGTPIHFEVDLRDEFGNVATIDTETDLLVKYSRQSSGEIVIGSIVRTFEGNKTGHGYKASVTLPRTGTYGVTAQLGPVSVCLPVTEDANAVNVSITRECILDANVVAAQTDPTMSLLQGSGTSAVMAGDRISLHVVPLDAFGNIVAEVQSRLFTRYTVNITSLIPASDKIIAGQVLMVDQALEYVMQIAGSHDITYQLQYAGTYAVNVTQIGAVRRLVGGATIHMTVRPAAAAVERTRVNVTTPVGLAAESGVVEVRLRDAFDNQIFQDRVSSIAVAIDPDSDAPAITVDGSAVRMSYSGQGLHLVRYNIPTAERYTVLLSVDTIPVPVSETFVVKPGPAVAAMSTAQGRGLQSAVAGQKATFAVYSTDRFGNLRDTPEENASASGGWFVSMSVSVGRGESSCETGKVSAIPADKHNLNWNSVSKHYEGEYTIQIAGLLSIRVNLAGEVGIGGPVRDSPFVSIVVAGNTHFPSCILSGTAIKGTVLGIDGAFSIKARDKFGNERTAGGDLFRLSISALGSASPPVLPPPIILLDGKDGTYTVTYKPTVAALYKIEIFLAYNQSLTHTRSLTIEALANSGFVSLLLSEATGTGVSSAVSGVASRFTITAVDTKGIRMTTGGLSFVVTLDPIFTGGTNLQLVRKTAFDANNNDVNVIRDEGDGTYTATYTVNKEGRYGLNVITVGGETIKVPPGETEWPVSVIAYSGATSAAHSVLDPSLELPTASTAGQTVMTRIMARDSNSNAQCYAAEGVGGDPFEVVATIDGNAVRSNVLNLNLTQNKAGGYYDVSMAPTKAGTYEFSFRLKGAVLSTMFSPNGALRQVMVRAATLDATFSIISGPALLGGPAGIASAANVYARDMYGNPISDGLSSSQCGAAITAEFAVGAGRTLSASAGCDLTDSALGIFTLRFLAGTSGKYTFDITLDGRRAGFSPYASVMFATGLSDAASTTVVGAGSGAAAAGAVTTLTVEARDVNGNQRSVGGEVVSGRVLVRSDPVWATTVDNLDGTYTLSYAVPVVGSFQLEVKLGTSSIKGSPFTLSVTPSNTSADQSFAEEEGVEAFGTAGSPQTFVIRPMNIHGGPQADEVVDDFKLAISPSGNTFGQTLEPSAVKRSLSEGGGYLVRWRADRILYDNAGSLKPYVLSVTHGGEHIKGSPFNMTLRPARAAATNTIISNAAGGLMRDEFNAVAGIRQNTVMQTRDIYNNDGRFDAFVDPVIVRVALNGTAAGTARGAEVLVAIQNLLDGTYRVSYTPRKSGAYGLYVSVDGEVIGPSAAAVSIMVAPGSMSPEHFAVWGPGATEAAEVAESMRFRVQTRDAYGNNRVDDGQLNQPGNYTLNVDIRVRVGDSVSSTTRLVPAESATLIYQAEAPAAALNETYTAGTYTVVFKFGVAGTLISHLNVNQAGVSAITHVVAASPYEVLVKRARMVGASMAGPGTESAALVPNSLETVNLAVVITPTDVNGNMAASFEGDPARFVLTVSPADRAVVVVAPSPDGTGALRGSWRATAIGDVTVSVTLDGVNVAGSPKVVTVNSTYTNINPELSRQSGPALDGGYVGRETSFLIEVVTDSGASYPVSADDWGSAACVPGSLSKGYVKVILDDIPLTGTRGKVVDNCNGTYTASTTHTVSGLRTFQTLLGPGTPFENPNFPDGIARVLRSGSFSPSGAVKVYSGPTASVTVVYLSEASTGIGHSGVDTVAQIYPVDEYGNKQDYVAFPSDDLIAAVTINALYTLPITLTPRFDASTIPVSTSLTATFKPVETGKYKVEVSFLRPDGTRKTAGSAFQIDVAPGTSSPETSVVSGTGVTVAVVGVEASFRVQLNDATGNPAFDGTYVAGAAGPSSSSTNAPSISVVEANLIPYGGNANSANVVKATLEYNAERGVYFGRYSALKVGRHTLQVLLYGEVISMDDAYLSTSTNVQPGSTSTSVCTAEGAGVGAGGAPINAGESARIVVVARDAFGNALETGGSIFSVLARSATYSNTGNPTAIPTEWTTNLDAIVAPPAPVDRGDGTYLTTFMPSVAATYLVAVTRGASHIKGSPFLITVTPAATSAVHSMLVCLTVDNCGLSTAVAGKTSTFFVIAKDRFNNTQIGSGGSKFNYAIVGGGGFTKVSIANEVGTAMPGWHEALFNTRVSGPATIRVTLGNDVVQVVKTTVSPSNVHPATCTTTSRAFPVATVGETYEVVVAARDVHGNQLTTGGITDVSIAISSDIGSYDLDVRDNSDGTYVAKFTIEKSGTWTVRPRFNSVGVTQTPLTVKAGQMALSRTLVTGEATFDPGPYVAGEPAVVTFLFSDAKSNIRYDVGDFAAGTLSLIVTKPDQTTSTMTVDAVDFYPENSTGSTSRGKFFVRFNPKAAGLLTIRFFSAGESLVNPSNGGLPFTATIEPSTPVINQTSVYGAGLKAAAMGRSNNINVLTADAFGNPITGQPTSASGARLDIKCTFIATGGGGNPGATVVSNMQQSTTYLGGGVSTVYYTPPTHSAAYSINVKVVIDGIEVPGTHTVLVSLGGDAYTSTTIILDTSLRPVGNVVTGFKAGIEAKLIIEPRDELGAPVGAAAANTVLVSFAPLVPHKLELTSQGRVALTFTTTVAGAYSLLIEAGTPEGYSAVGGNWNSLDPTPGYLNVIVSPATRSLPSRTSVLRLPDEEITAGLSASLRLQSRDEYGNLASYSVGQGADRYRGDLIRDPVEGGSSAPVRAVLINNEDGTYDLNFKPTMAGRYSLVVTLDDKDVPATNNIYVTVVHAGVFAAASTFSPKLDVVKTIGVAGQLFTFSIEARDAFANFHVLGDQTFALTVTPPPGAAMVMPSITPQPNGTYTALFAPLAAGNYTLTVRHVASALLVLENFIAEVVPSVADKNRLVIAGPGVNGGVAGVRQGLTLTVRDAYNNLLHTSVAGITLNVHTSADLSQVANAAVSPLVGSTGALSASYTVPNPGVYWLAVRVNGDLTLGAPFRLDISPTPAPTLARAELSPSLLQIDVTFSMATDLGGMVATGACAAFFEAQTAIAAGAGASCVWTDDTTLTIFFGSDSTLIPGATVALKPGVVHNKIGNSHTASGTTVVTASSVKQPPVAVISAAQDIGPCDGVLLDGSSSRGGGARPMKHEFYVKIVAADASAVAVAINKAMAAAEAANGGVSSSIIALAAADLPSGMRYEFFVRVTDFAGGTSESSTFVEKSNFPRPMAQVLGGSDHTARRSVAVTLEAEASLPSSACDSVTQASVGDGIVYRWSLIDGPLLNADDFSSPEARTLHLATLTSRALYIPPRTLTAGHTYTWRLRSALAVNAALFSDAEVNVHVVSSRIETNLLSGAVRTAFLTAPLTLEVAPVDPDDAKNSQGLPYPTAYAWSCSTDDGPDCLLPSGRFPEAFYTSTPKVIFPAGVLEARTYVFTVRIAREPLEAGRDVNVSMTVTLRNPPSVVNASSASAATLRVTGTSTGITATSDRLTLRAEIANCPGGVAACGVTWTCEQGDLYDPTGGTELLVAAAETPLNQGLLSIRPGELTPGQQYVFRAAATGNAEGLTADAAIDANAPPQGGRLTASAVVLEPAAAMTLARLGVGRFVVRALGWADQTEHYPLSYEFYKKTGRGAAAVLVPLSATQSANMLEVFLPAGNHTIQVRVADAYGAASIASTIVTVAAPPVTGKRRRSLLQTNFAELGEARVLIQELVDPAVKLGAATQVVQVARIYADKFARTPPGTIIRACVEPGAIAVEHAAVAAALKHVRDTTVRTGPGVTQVLCAAAPLASDPLAVSVVGATAVAEILTADAAAAVSAAGPSVDNMGLTCAVGLASNLIAAEVSGCFGPTPPAAASRSNITTAIDQVAAGVGRALLPGGACLNIESTHVSLAVRAAEPSAAVGFPLNVTFDAAGASATYALPSASLGAGFSGGQGSMVVSVVYFREGSAVPAAAATALGERLVSKYTTLRMSHPNPAAAAAAVDTLTVTLGYAREQRNASANAGRYPAVRFYDAAAAAAPATGERYPGWLEKGVTGRSVEAAAAATVTGIFKPLPNAHLSMAVVMVNVAEPPPPSPWSPPPGSPPPSPPPPLLSPPPDAIPKSKDNTQLYIIAGACSGGGVLLGFIALGFWYATRKNAAASKAAMKSGFSDDPGGVRFDPFGGVGGGASKKQIKSGVRKAVWEKQRLKAVSAADVEAGGGGGGGGGGVFSFGRKKPSKVSPTVGVVVSKPVIDGKGGGDGPSLLRLQSHKSVANVGSADQSMRAQHADMIRERDSAPAKEIDPSFVWEGATLRGNRWDGDVDVDAAVYEKY